MPESSSKFKIAITSMLAMVVVMGLGRFALTPQLPHMIAEKQITLTQASLLAAANFLGYLLGAIETIRARSYLIFRLKTGLWATGIILVLSSFQLNQIFGVNLLLRFLAGIASAWTLVLITAWVQQRLKEDHILRTVAFSGPGVGITVSGLLALELDIFKGSASLNWLVYGVMALILVLVIYKNLPASLTEAASEKVFPMTINFKFLMISYCLCGVAYVLPATFLSKLAFDQFPGSLWADAFWPLFGLAVVLGMVWLGFQKIRSPQKWLAMIFCVQGMGVLACGLLPGIGGLLIGTFFVGGSFIAILQLTMSLGASLAPAHVRAMSAVLTTAFALGQFIGPVFSALSTHFYASIIPALLMSAVVSFVAAFMVNLIPNKSTNPFL